MEPEEGVGAPVARHCRNVEEGATRQRCRRGEHERRVEGVGAGARVEAAFGAVAENILYGSVSIGAYAKELGRPCLDGEEDERGPKEG